jgi:hypothetical protein
VRLASGRGPTGHARDDARRAESGEAPLGVCPAPARAGARARTRRGLREVSPAGVPPGRARGTRAGRRSVRRRGLPRTEPT